MRMSVLTCSTVNVKGLPFDGAASTFHYSVSFMVNYIGIIGHVVGCRVHSLCVEFTHGIDTNTLSCMCTIDMHVSVSTQLLLRALHVYTPGSGCVQSFILNKMTYSNARCKF
jgi:hypothetical protein